MKPAQIGFALVAIGGIGFGAALVHRRPVPVVQAAPVAPAEAEHFAGSAETLSPAALRQAHVRNRAEMAQWHRDQDALQRSIERRVEIARARRESIRLPPDYHWGRCLLVVNGRTRISGRCAYSAGDNGSLSIQGPRQIYGGMDYPQAGSMAEERSNDYWASVFRQADGSWTGYGNADIRAVHGEGPGFGALRRRGACWVNRIARICQWKA